MLCFTLWLFAAWLRTALHTRLALGNERDFTAKMQPSVVSPQECEAVSAQVARRFPDLSVGETPICVNRVSSDRGSTQLPWWTPRVQRPRLSDSKASNCGNRDVRSKRGLMTPLRNHPTSTLPRSSFLHLSPGSLTCRPASLFQHLCILPTPAVSG